MQKKTYLGRRALDVTSALAAYNIKVGSALYGL
jgi:hypothetical protein